MAGIIILSQTYHGFTLLLAGALVGAGLGTIQSSVFAIATRVVPIHQTGLASSTVMMIMDIWGGSGPFVFGLIVPLTGYRGMYLVAAAIVLACTFLYYLLHGREAERVKIGNKQET
jgi:MFS family permease